MIMITSQIFAGNVYYVDAINGNDQNDGLSEGTAWKTFDKVRSMAYFPGDTIKFKRGETFDLTYDNRWTLYDSGTPGNYITIEDYGTGTKPIWNAIETISGGWSNEGRNVWSKPVAGTVKRCFLDANESAKAPNASSIDGSTYLWYSDGNKLYVYSTQNPDDEYNTIKIMRISVILYLPGVSYIKIQNIRMEGGSAILMDTWRGNVSYIQILNNDFWYANGYIIHASANEGEGNTISHIKIDGNDFDGKLNLIDKAIDSNQVLNFDSVSFETAVINSTISNNTFRDWWHSGIAFDSHETSEAGVNNNIIEHNTFYGDDSPYCRAFHFNGTEGKCTSNIFRYNWIEGCNIRSQINGNGNKIYYNIFYNTVETPCPNKSNESEAVSFEGYGWAICKDNEFYNNIIYGAFNEGIQILDSGIEPDGNIIKNNIIADVGKGGDHLNTCIWYASNITSGTQTINNNCFYDADTASVINHKGMFYIVNNVNGLLEYSNNIGSNPLFTNPLNEDFTLQTGSFCINAGTNVGLIQDYTGNAVPYGGGVDIGAYEYQGSVNPLSAEINASPTSGYTPLSINFTGSASGGKSPYTYSWDFGDGNTSSSQNPSYTYSTAGTYTVTLTVTDSNTNTATDTLTITATSPPVPLSVSASASTTSGEAPLTVNFTGSASGGTSPYSYSWNFDDGQSSSEQNPSHTFNSSGTYTVTLTVTDSTSNTATDSLTINVQEKISPLTASASGSPTSGQAPLSVSFSGSSSGGKSPYTYSWDFGDGSTSSTQNPSHTYSSTGTYTIILTVTDSNSSTATDSLTITVTSPPAAEANLSISSLTGSPAPGSGGTTDPSPGNHSYAVGSSAQVKAKPNSDYRFAKWSGDVNSSDLYVPQITITLDKDKSVSAHFYTKCGDVNGDLSITPADAQAAFDIFLGKTSNPTESELENADVNCDGTKTAPNITPADAQAIFEKFLGKNDLPCNCSAGSRASTLSGRIEQASNINLIINDIRASQGEEIVVPIIVDDAFRIKSFGFDLIFSPEALEFVGVEKSESTEDFDKLEANMIAEGVVRAGGYKNIPFSEHQPRVLINLVFRVIGSTNKPISLTIVNTVDDIMNAPVIKGKYTKEIKRPGHVR